MKLRAGNYGDDMWPLCRDNGIASMTHGPIFETDLTKLAKHEVDRDVKASARTSIWRFAWDIVGGDVIYVGDSKTKRIIARGYVLGEPRKRAYRYNSSTAITEPNNPAISWRHEVPVEWDHNFVPFAYPRDPAPRYTVIPFLPPSRSSLNREPPAPQEADNEEFEPLLNSDEYMRETKASARNIKRLHAKLSNDFRLWLENSFNVKAKQEEHRVDVRFNLNENSHLAELKICYGANTRHAIRGALGQIFEYNHYPDQELAKSWWIVLDHKPSNADLIFISSLRQAYGLPLILCWLSGGDFEVSPQLPADITNS